MKGQVNYRFGGQAKTIENRTLADFDLSLPGVHYPLVELSNKRVRPVTSLWRMPSKLPRI